jgi:hypothetical protein
MPQFQKLDTVHCTLDTVKFVFSDNPRDPKFVAVVDMWSVIRGKFML